MKLGRKAKNFIATNMAAATLAFGLAAGSPAWAQEGTEPDATDTAITEQTNSPPADTLTQDSRELTKTWSVAVDPLIPLAPLGGMFALAMLLSVYAARHRSKGAVLRAGAALALSGVLLNPEIMQEEREPLPTEVLIVVDKSASQVLNGRDKTTEEIYTRLAGEMTGLKGVNIRMVEFDGRENGNTIDGSNLFGVIDAAMADIPRDRLGAVIMLTDGQVHDIPSLENVAYTLGQDVPLHVLVSGQEGETDRRIVIEQAPRFGLVNAEQTIKFKVIDEGAIPGPDNKARVVVTSDGREISSQEVTPGQIAEVTVRMPHAGSNFIELRVEALPGELTEVNNRVVTSIEGIRETLSVLLVSGKPNPGTRMWRDLLKSDPDADVVHFTIMRPPGKEDYVPLKDISLTPVPTEEIFSARGLGKFDLIIFDNYEYRALLAPAYFNNIANYVKNGGALLVVAGPEYAGYGSLHNTPLGAVLPAGPAGRVTEQPYKPAVTEQGKRHPVTRNLGDYNMDNPDWGRWFSIVDLTAPEGNVVMAGAGNRPLVVLDREGEGRVAMIASDQAWLWARGFEGGGPYADLLRNTAHWLMKNPALEEEALRVTQREGELVIEQQTMADRSAPVTIRTPSGGTITVTPEKAGLGLWQAVVPADEPGLYSAEQQGRPGNKAFISVGHQRPREFANTVSTPELLRPFVEESGGRIARMTDVEGVPNIPRIQLRKAGETDKGMAGPDWLGIRVSDASVLRGVKSDPVIPPWLGFILAVGLMAGAWYREGERPLFRRNDPAPGSNGPSV